MTRAIVACALLIAGLRLGLLFGAIHGAPLEEHHDADVVRVAGILAGLLVSGCQVLIAARLTKRPDPILFWSWVVLLFGVSLLLAVEILRRFAEDIPEAVSVAWLSEHKGLAFCAALVAFLPELGAAAVARSEVMANSDTEETTEKIEAEISAELQRSRAAHEVAGPTASDLATYLQSKDASFLAIIGNQIQANAEKRLICPKCLKDLGPITGKDPERMLTGHENSCTGKNGPAVAAVAAVDAGVAESSSL